MCSALSFLTPTFTIPLSSSLSSLALISLLSCVDYLWRLLTSPLVIPHTFTRNPHIYTPFSAPSCPTFSSLFSQVVSSPSLPCIPCVHSPLSCHPFVLLPMDRAPTAPRLPFTHWCHRGSKTTFNRQSSLCSQCFIMALVQLPAQAILIVAEATLNELMPASYVIIKKRKNKHMRRESKLRKTKTEQKICLLWEECTVEK